jgi:hypothetical protein
MRNRKKLITVLQDGSGQEKVNHSDKAYILWEAFENRLSTSEYEDMLFDLEDLLTLDADL